MIIRCVAAVYSSGTCSLSSLRKMIVRVMVYPQTVCGYITLSPYTFPRVWLPPSSSVFPDSAARDVMLRFISQHLGISTEPSSTATLRVERVLPFRHIRQGLGRFVRALMLSKLNDAHEWASLFWSRVTTERCYC